MKLKNILAFCMVMLIVGSFIPKAEAVYAGNITEDGFTFEGDTVFAPGMSITGYEGEPKANLIIPSVIRGIPVTTIELSAFAGMEFIESITIPKTVKFINSDAFNGCTGIESIEIPKSVATISTDVFKGCSSLKEVIFCDDKIALGDGLFKNCTALTEIILPNGATKIEPEMFSGCTALKNVVIPESVKEIGTYAFNNCTGLESIVLPKRIERIDDGAFYKCTALKSIEYPEGLKSISRYAFFGCSSLESVTLHADTQPDPAMIDYFPEGTKYVIEPFAFVGCTSLKDIYFYGTLNDWNSIYWFDQRENDGHEIFLKATLNYQPLNIAEGIYYDIDKEAEKATITDYEGTLAELTLPATIEGYPVSIGQAAFSYNGYIENIIIPEGVTEIGGSAFYSCPQLKNVSIPKTVTTIGSEMFYNCTALESITIPDWITAVGDESFANCSNLKSVVIPNTVEKIGMNAFKGCTSLEGINLPSNLELIDTMAFFGSGLKTVIIPEGVTKINSAAFRNCASLKAVTLPASLESVQQGAFYGCTALTDVYYTGNAEDWTDIYISSSNEPLTNATLHAHIHNWQYLRTTREATCSREGEKLYNCSSCGGQKTEVIEKLAHKEVIDAAVTVSCGEDGLTEGKHCSVCGEVIIAQQIIEALPHTYDSDCDEICNVCYSTREAEDHKYDNVCDDTCQFCGATREVEGHKYDNDCDATCEYCGDSREVEGHKYDNECDAKCNICSSERTVVGHQFEWVIDKSADCKNKGKKHEECKLCHTKRNENTEIPVTAQHTYTNDCDASCDVCFTERTVAHNYEWVIDKPAGCNTTGKKHEKCTICGKDKLSSVTIPATGEHKYEYSCSTKCSGCGKTRVAYHRYEWITDKQSTCSVAGSKHEECSICHTMRNVGTKISATGNHSYKTVLVKATLTKDGKITKKCTACGHSTSASTVKKIFTVKLSATSYTYDGKAKKPTVTVKDSAGKVVSSKYYTVSGNSGVKNVGKYKVTVTFKGNYSGTKALYFTILPPKTAVKKLTPAKKSFQVFITKKSAQVTGYQIQYSPAKNFTGAKTKTVSSYKTTSQTIKSLKAKSTYYVRIRTYKKVGNTTYYSAWSSYKTVKTK